MSLTIVSSTAALSAAVKTHSHRLKKGSQLDLSSQSDLSSDSPTLAAAKAPAGSTQNALSRLFGDKNLDVVAQRALVAFQRENVVGLLVHDFLRDVALAAHGIDGDDRAFDRQQVEQLGNCHDFIGLFRHLDLPEDEPLAGGKG